MKVPNIASHFCVKTAIIALEKFLNLDCILTARTVPGHSHHNAAEKINCRLNLGLYNIGVMKKSSINLKFEHKLKNCSHLMYTSWYMRAQKKTGNCLMSHGNLPPN